MLLVTTTLVPRRDMAVIVPPCFTRFLFGQRIE
jgi:hypothetical protein